MRKRRHLKPGTVSGLSGHHLGMTVRIDGTDYHLTFVSHQRRTVRVVAEWDDPDDDTVYCHGDREFPASTPCTVVGWRVWFRPSGWDQLRALLYFNGVVAPERGIQDVDDPVAKEQAKAYADEVTWDPVKMREIRAWNEARREAAALEGGGS